MLAAQHEVAAHARGQVEHHVDVGGAHALDHLAVQPRVARPLAGRGIAYVNVRDRRAGASRLDRGVGDLLRRDGHPIAAIGRGAGTGDGAGDEGFPLHESASVAIRSAEQGAMPTDSTRRLSTGWLSIFVQTVTPTAVPTCTRTCETRTKKGPRGRAFLMRGVVKR